uniref:SURF1-like protein n=1 Tax=Mycena chlorophos TaxID=658473 RepID=A0ABQ0M6S2_MYCCL|nr:predicted protein [Mycena chlorophos]
MVLLGFVPIFTLGLGTWQLQRLQWKVALIDELEEKLQLQAISLPKRINLAVLPEFEFRKVSLRGKWDHDHSMLIGPRTREGVHGANVVTPLVREDGTTVLVDRGFIPKELDLNSIQRETGEVEVLGMLRTSEKRNTFTPDNLPERGEWYWKDVEAMAEYAGGTEANVQPVLVEEIFEGHEGEASARLLKGIPVGRPARVDLRNSHLSYVITWYSLSVFTAVITHYSRCVVIALTCTWHEVLQRAADRARSHQSFVRFVRIWKVSLDRASPALGIKGSHGRGASFATHSMPSATVRFVPTTPRRSQARRNTVDSSPKREKPIIERVKVVQKEQPGHQYRDDHTSFDRAKREEEERALHDLERATRAKRREEARKVARKSGGSRDSWNPAEHIVSSVPLSPHRGSLRAKENDERGRLESFKFPRLKDAAFPYFKEEKPTQPELLHANWCPPSPSKRLAPLAPYNPFVRARSESLSSVVDSGPPSPAKHKRAVSAHPRPEAPVQALFQRIHAEARRQGYQI